MSVLVSHPTGNPNVRAVLRALETSGHLHSFHTSMAIPRRLARMPFMPATLKRELERRVFDEIPAIRTLTHPYRETIRVLSNRLGLQPLIRHETGFASIDRVYYGLDRAVARYLAKPGSGIRAVYAYDDGALHSFRTARVRGIKTIYDLPTAHWRTWQRILDEEQEIRPEWASTLSGLKDSTKKRDRKDEELALADHIVVASNFTRQSIINYVGKTSEIYVTPYGAPYPRVKQPIKRSHGERFKIYYAGNLFQNKGISYLSEALNRSDFPWKLTLAGSKPPVTCFALENFLGDERCRWLGPIPHARLLEEMAQAHVFVFPSLIEGFGLVILEAMAAGLPVITTPNTAGPECIDDGVDGFVVPIRDAEAITCRLAALYDDEDRRFAMASAALAKAGRLTWARYEEQIAALVRKATA